MRWKLIVLPMLVLLMAGLAVPARSQVTYSAEEGKLPWTVGTGFSNFSLDWGTRHPRMNGIALWVDWRASNLPPVVRGLGIEFEGRDVNWSAPTGLEGHRMDTALGGPMYEWRRESRIRPFAKFLMGIGSIDFPGANQTQNHDTLTVLSPSGGANVLVWNQFSVRAEYEYQFWKHFLNKNDLNPNGLTIGAVYDFGRRAAY